VPGRAIVEGDLWGGGSGIDEATGFSCPVESSGTGCGVDVVGSACESDSGIRVAAAERALDENCRTAGRVRDWEKDVFR
jgi:hypothetical protein